MGDYVNNVSQNLMGTFNELLAAPVEAIQLWPIWFGFAGLEYFSDWVQVTAMDMTNDMTYKRAIGAVTRGAILATNLIYYTNATSPS